MPGDGVTDGFGDNEAHFGAAGDGDLVFYQPNMHNDGAPPRVLTFPNCCFERLGIGELVLGRKHRRGCA